MTKKIKRGRKKDTKHKIISHFISDETTQNKISININNNKTLSSNINRRDQQQREIHRTGKDNA